MLYPRQKIARERNNNFQIRKSFTSLRRINFSIWDRARMNRFNYSRGDIRLNTRKSFLTSRFVKVVELIAWGQCEDFITV